MRNLLGLFRAEVWPPSAPLWGLCFLMLFLLFGLLSLWRRGQVLMLATLSGVLLGLAVVLVRSDTTAALACLLWMAAAGAALGTFGIRLSGVGRREPLCGTERLGLSLLLGFGLLSLLAGVLAWARLLNRASVILMLGVVTLPALVWAGRLPQASQRCLSWAGSQWRSNDMRWPAVGAASLAVCFGFPLMWALAPSVHWDSLASHLPVAAAYASPAGFSAVSELWYSYFSGQSHLLYALALALVGQPLSALTHFAFGLVITLLVFSLARHLAGPTAGWVGALAFASMPMVSWEAGTAYLDLFATGYVFGSFYAVFRWCETKSWGWLLLAGLLGGMAVGTKLSAAMFMVGPSLYVLAVSLRSGGLKALVRASATYALPLALTPIPWLVRNWLWTGNPVYPMLGKVFGNAELEGFPVNWDSFGVGRGPLYLLRLPYDLVVHGKAYDEAGLFAFGIVPLAAVASVLLGWRHVRAAVGGPMLGFAVAGITLWFATAQVGRYLLPLMPLLAVLAALPVPSLCNWLAARSRAALVVLGALGLLYLACTRGVVTLWNYNLPEGYPYRYALGLETKEQFLERALRVYPAQRYINAHATRSSRVFSPTSQIRFYSQVPLDDPVYNLRTTRLVRLPAGGALAEEMWKMGYDYLLVDHMLLKPDQAGTPFTDEDFLRRFSRLVYAHMNVSVYKLGLRPTVSGELASNGSFEDLGSRQIPFAWESFGNPKIVLSSEKCYSAPVCVDVSQNDGLYQRVTARPGALYTVRLWARAEKPGQSVWLQVVWLDSSINILDTGIAEFSVTSKWQKFHASFTAPKSNTAFVQVYARAAHGSTVFVDDVSLVQEM